MGLWEDLLKTIDHNDTSVIEEVTEGFSSGGYVRSDKSVAEEILAYHHDNQWFYNTAVKETELHSHLQTRVGSVEVNNLQDNTFLIGGLYSNCPCSRQFGVQQGQQGRASPLEA